MRLPYLMLSIKVEKDLNSLSIDVFHWSAVWCKGVFSLVCGMQV